MLDMSTCWVEVERDLWRSFSPIPLAERPPLEII